MGRCPRSTVIHRCVTTLVVCGSCLVARVAPIAGQVGQEPGDRARLFVLPEHDLYPESVAYDSAAGEYLVGSMGQSRILRVSKDGSYRDLVRGVEGLGSSVGIKIDPLRRRAWVCTGRYVLFGGPTDDEPRTGVLLFDLDTGALLRRWLIPQPTPTQIFNDLAVAKDGSVYVTTTLLGRVYHITAESSDLELVYDADGRQTNGVTFDALGRFLFFTVDRGIVRLDLATGAARTLRSGDQAEAGTDGLYSVPGGLIAIQPRRRRIVRLRLDARMEAIVGVDTLRADHPDFAYPTTGVLVGDTLVYVATSYADHPRRPDAKRQHPDVVIGRLPLRRPAR